MIGTMFTDVGDKNTQGRKNPISTVFTKSCITGMLELFIEAEPLQGIVVLKYIYPFKPEYFSNAHVLLNKWSDKEIIVQFAP